MPKVSAKQMRTGNGKVTKSKASAANAKRRSGATPAQITSTALGSPVTPQGDTTGAVSALLNLRTVTPNTGTTNDTTQPHNYGLRKGRGQKTNRSASGDESQMDAATGNTNQKKKGRTIVAEATTPVITDLRTPEEEIAYLRSQLAGYQNVEPVDTPKTAELKALRAQIAEHKATLKTANTLSRKNLFNQEALADSEDETSSNDSVIDVTRLHPPGESIPFADHQNRALEDMIRSGAPVFGAMTNKAPLHSIAEGMLICLAIPTSQTKTEFEFMQVGQTVGSTTRALKHVATSRSPRTIQLSAKTSPTVFLAPTTEWYFTLDLQSLSELAIMSHVDDGYQINGKCQPIPIVIVDNQTASDFYGTNADSFNRSKINNSSATMGTAIHNSSSKLNNWSDELHAKARDSIPQNEAHLYYEVSVDSIRRSKELTKANPDIRIDKAFQQSKTADSLANKGMNLTVAEIVSISPHDSTRRLQQELLGRYFRTRKSYMPLCVLIKLAGSWTLPFGGNGIFYFMDLNEEFGHMQASTQVRLFIQPKSAECLTSITTEFTNYAAAHRKSFMDRFTISSARTTMLNFVYAISLVHDMKYKFQRALIAGVHRLFSYIEAHTLGNHTVKNIEFIKSSMILLADAWETQRLDMSVRGKSEVDDILLNFNNIPDLSPSGLIAQTKRHLQHEDEQSTVRILLHEISVGQASRDSKKDATNDLTNLNADKKNKKDKKDKKPLKADKLADGDTLAPTDTDVPSNDPKSQKSSCIYYCSASGCNKPSGRCLYNHVLPDTPQKLQRMKSLLLKRKLVASASFTAACSGSTN